MNKGLELFYNFFIEKVVEGKETEAKSLLEESFKKQAEGTFDLNYLNELMPKLLLLVKPEAVEEVKQAMNHFSSTLK